MTFVHIVTSFFRYKFVVKNHCAPCRVSYTILNALAGNFNSFGVRSFAPLDLKGEIDHAVTTMPPEHQIALRHDASSPCCRTRLL
jgi:hypothetical protein